MKNLGRYSPSVVGAKTGGKDKATTHRHPRAKIAAGRHYRRWVGSHGGKYISRHEKALFMGNHPGNHTLLRRLVACDGDGKGAIGILGGRP